MPFTLKSMAHGCCPWQVVDEGCERHTRTCWGAQSAGSPEDSSLAGLDPCLRPWNMAEGWWTSSLPSHMSPLDARSCRPLHRCLLPNPERSRRSSAQEGPGERHYQGTPPPDHLHIHRSRPCLQEQRGSYYCKLKHQSRHETEIAIIFSVKQLLKWQKSRSGLNFIHRELIGVLGRSRLFIAGIPSEWF